MIQTRSFLPSLLIILSLLMVTARAQEASARSKIPFDIGLELVTSNLKLPVYATNAGDGSNRLFVVQLEGLVRIVKDGKVLNRPFLDLRDRVTGLVGEQGMYNIVFHPNYQTNGRFFMSYTQIGTGRIVVAEYRVSDSDPDYADPNAFEKILFAIDTEEPFHHGAQLAFGPDGYLYVGVGSGERSMSFLRQETLTPQNLASLRGKLLRIDVDRGDPYAIPADNPFMDLEGVRPEIYALGFRNPWKFSFDRQTGQLFLADVGESRWEEINLIKAGGNYGWPLKEANECFTFPDDGALVRPDCPTITGLEPPIAYYGHLSFEPTGGNAVTGGYVYRGQEFPELAGRYIFGDFTVGRLWSLYESTPGNWVLEDIMQTPLNISSFAEDEAGELYVIDINGGLYHLVVNNRDESRNFAKPMIRESLEANWFDWFGWGEIGFDPLIKKEGQASLRITTPKSVEPAGAISDTRQADWSGRSFSFFVRSDNWQRITESSFALYTSKDYSSYFRVDLRAHLVTPPDNEWLEIVLSPSSFAEVGTPSWLNVENLLFTAASEESYEASVWFDDLAIFETADTPVVSISFDDGRLSQYQYAKPILDKYGLTATAYIIPERLGSSSFLTQEQVDELAAAGWDISGHGENSLTELSGQELDEELRAIRAYLDKYAYKGAENFAYPGGAYNDDVIGAVAKYFETARTIDDFGQPHGYTTPYRISALSVSSQTSLELIYQRIDKAITNNDWLILNFHKLVVDSPRYDSEYKISDFEAVINYLVAKRVTIRPVSEVIAAYTNH